jgi:hypothetical protein
MLRRDLEAYIRQNRLDKPVVGGAQPGRSLALALAGAGPGMAGPLVIVDSPPSFGILPGPD